MVSTEWGSSWQHGGNESAGTAARGRTAIDGYLRVQRFHGAGSTSPIGGGPGKSESATDNGDTKLVGNGGAGNTKERQESQESVSKRISIITGVFYTDWGRLGLPRDGNFSAWCRYGSTGY